MTREHVQALCSFLLTAMTVVVPNRVLAQTTEWAVPISGPQTQPIYDVAVDAERNVFVSGFTGGDVDFHPGSADSLVPFSGAWFDLVLASYDPDGALRWGKVWGGALADVLYTVAVDPAGEVYTGGRTNGGFDADPGPGVTMLPPLGHNIGLLMKFTNDGTLLWANTLNGYFVSVDHIVATPDGGSICMGIFQDTLDADPGPDSTLLISSEETNVFLCSYDANGALRWARSFGGDDSAGDDLKVTSNGDIVLSFNFKTTIDADPGPDTLWFTNTTLQDDIALMRIDPAGQLLWADHIHGTDYAESGRALALDQDDNILLTGWFCFNSDLDPGPGTYIVTDEQCATFVAHYDGSGTFLSAFTLGDAASPDLYDLTVRNDGVLLVVGHTWGTVDMDPGPGEFLLTTEHASGIVGCYTADGVLLTADTIGAGLYSEGVTSATVDLDNAFVITGIFGAPSDIAPGPMTAVCTPQDVQDSYVVKFDLPFSTAVAAAGTRNPAMLTLRPTLTDGSTLSIHNGHAFLGPITLTLFDAQGRVLSTSAINGLPPGPTPLPSSLLDGRANGVYHLHVSTAAKQHDLPFVLMR